MSNENRIKIAPLPEWIKAALGTPREVDRSKNKEAVVELDEEANIQAAIEYLKSAPPSKQGEGGDSAAYQIASRVKDLGISETLGVDLALRFWYPRCEPDNKPAFVARKFKNAYAYGQNPPGSGTPQAYFSPVPESQQSPQQRKSSRMMFRSAKELISDLRPPEWLIDGYFEQGTTVLLFGDSGSLKSFLSIDMGLRIATGLPWAGREVKQGPVFYLAGEGHGGIKRRIAAWFKHQRLDAESNYPFYVSAGAVQLDEATNAQALVEAMVSIHGRPGAIFIDTLATAFGGGDENATKDMNRFLNNVNAGIRQPLGSALFIVHHTGHTEKNRPRGAYTLYAGVDSCFRVERESDSLRVKLCKPEKLKDGEPPEDTWFQGGVVIIESSEQKPFSSLALDYVPGYAPAKQAPKGLGANQQYLLDCLKGGPLEKERLKVLFETYKGTEYDRRAFHKAKASLKSKGLIAEDGGVIRPVILCGCHQTSQNVTFYDEGRQGEGEEQESEEAQDGNRHQTSQNVTFYDGHARSVLSPGVTSSLKGGDDGDTTRSAKANNKTMAEESTTPDWALALTDDKTKLH